MIKTAFASMIAFTRKNTVLCIAAASALITACIIPPDAAYLGYFDFRTLTYLFCVLAVVCALRNINFFYVFAKRIVALFRNAKMEILSLVWITFLGSMLIANDMALLTFLPLGYFVLTTTHKEKYMAFTFVMQNIAANLGGMLTPSEIRRTCTFIPIFQFRTMNSFRSCFRNFWSPCFLSRFAA